MIRHNHSIVGLEEDTTDLIMFLFTTQEQLPFETDILCEGVDWIASAYGDDHYEPCTNVANPGTAWCANHYNTD